MPKYNSEDEWLAYKEKQYLKHSAHCPICNSGNIDAGDIDIDSDGARQYITCLDCDAEWSDEYRLVGVSIDSYPTDAVPAFGPNEKFKRKKDEV